MTLEITLFNSAEVALVNDDDFTFLSQWDWRKTEPRSGYVYAARSQKIARGQWRVVFMHREILKPSNGMMVDHINHDGLDNRRANLRVATPSQNSANARTLTISSSGFRGVSFHIHRGDYIAQIRKDGKGLFLGYFDSPAEAARAYDQAAQELHGEFAVLNFPTTGEVRQMAFSFNPTHDK